MHAGAKQDLHRAVRGAELALEALRNAAHSSGTAPEEKDWLMARYGDLATMLYGDPQAPISIRHEGLLAFAGNRLGKIAEVNDR